MILAWFYSITKNLNVTKQTVQFTCFSLIDVRKPLTRFGFIHINARVNLILLAFYHFLKSLPLPLAHYLRTDRKIYDVMAVMSHWAHDNCYLKIRLETKLELSRKKTVNWLELHRSVLGSQGKSIYLSWLWKMILQISWPVVDTERWLRLALDI